MADAPDFRALRRQGIAFAQEASGEIWTDFNVHDPGVTLLEAFAFALTELAYRADFPTADLLTGPDGRLDQRRLALLPPLAVLATRPVTARDLALALTAADPAVERVIVRPRGGPEAGLLDLYVVPAPDADRQAALAAVRRAFHAHRNLCEDAATLALAVPVPCRLEARVEMRRRDRPERVAALVYDRCRRLMRDRRAAAPRPAATRRDAFDDPARLYGQLADPDGGASSLDAFFAPLTSLDEVEDVTALAFRRVGDTARDAFALLAPGEYRELVLPEAPGEVGLVLTSRELTIPFDLAGMREELSRLRADHVARLSDALDRQDWAEVPAGRRRDFRHLPLGHALPPAYGAGHERPPRSAAPRAQAAAAQLRGYLAIGDALLADAGTELAGLPDLFAADLAVRASYPSLPLDLTPMPELALSPSGDRLDPWHDRKGRVLDHLLALHGEELTQNSLRQYDLYRSQTGRRDAVLANRVRFLAEVAALNRDRGGAGDVPAGERAQAGGFGRKLSLLLDFPDRSTAPLAAAVARAGLALAPGFGPEGDWRRPRREAAAPDDPFLTLVERLDPPAAPPAADTAGLLAATPFLRGRTVGEEVLRRGVLGEAWLVAPEAGGWRLLLDPGAGDELLDAGAFPDRPAAVLRGNALRSFLADLNRRSEGFHLVEDVLLRGTGAGFAPLALTLVFAGWSARSAAPGFRSLAEETLALLCPAHLLPRALWLGYAAMQEFEALELAWRVAYRDAIGGGPRGGDLDRAAAALRGFLADAGR